MTSSKQARIPAPGLRRFPFSLPPMELGVKMALFATAGVLLFVGSFGFLGMTALRESTDANLQGRVVLAQNTARHMDYVLSSIESVIANPVAPVCWLNWDQAISFVDCAYHHLDFFASQAILVDTAGQVVVAYPPLKGAVSFADYASVQAVLNGQRFVVSRYLRPLNADTYSALAASPAYDSSGRLRGALVIAIDLAGPGIRTFSGPLDVGETGYMDLVDLGGTVMASTRPERVGQASDHRQTLSGLIQTHRRTVSTCHDCHDADVSSLPTPTREILAFAPLENAAWGITVRQSEDEVLTSTRLMQGRILALLAVYLSSAVVLVYVFTLSILRPIQALTAATERISAGDLETPIGCEGRDEIGLLARSFDKMREQLRTSMAEIRVWNEELEARVQDRTTQCKAAAQEIGLLYENLREKEAARGALLRKVIGAQEEERRRIARELHDETSQTLTAVSVGLETAIQAPAESVDEVKQRLLPIMALSTRMLEEVQRMVRDLRPSLLDDIGLISAIDWYSETRLKHYGVQVSLEVVGTERRLPTEIETTIFRLAQEAISNVAKHSGAENVAIVLDFRDQSFVLEIDDDGKGFDVGWTLSHEMNNGSFGLIGMGERIGLFGGTLSIKSQPDEGTSIRIELPIPASRGGDHGQTQDQGRAG